MKKRIVMNSVLFASLLLLPWWMTIILIIIALLLFSDFYEAIGWGVAIDLLYGTQSNIFSGFYLFNGLSMLILFAFFCYFKKQLRFY